MGTPDGRWFTRVIVSGNEIDDGHRPVVPGAAPSGEWSGTSGPTGDRDSGHWSWSLPWATAAVVLVATLGLTAPSGLALLAFLAVVITTHEAGHLFMARRAGMTPTEFFWGFGPELVAVEVGGCRYGFRLLPVGGYVRIEGMTPSSELPDGFPEAGTFRAAPVGGRLTTVLAGPVVNLALAAVAFGVAALLEGAPPSVAAGRAVGDLWAVVAGTADALATWVANLGAYLRSVLDPSGATEAPVRFLSPVGQAQVTAQAVEAGPVTVLRWFAILSAAIGAVNLLPLPPLDGAHATVAVLDGLGARLRPGRAGRLDLRRAVPLAYLTVGALVLLSVSALVLDLRQLG